MIVMKSLITYWTLLKNCLLNFIDVIKKYFYVIELVLNYFNIQ
jgi:hypothetical protein